MSQEDKKSVKEEYLECASRLRNDKDAHYNCAQSVLIPFAADCGLSEEKARELGTNFGSGMKMGACCGAITGGLMVIGMMGGGDEQYRTFMDSMRRDHDGLVNCSDLLRKNAEAGGDKKTHCDNMVYEAVEKVIDAMK